MLSCMQGGDVVQLNLSSDKQAVESSTALVKATATAGVTVLSIPCDLASFSSVRQAAARVKDAFPDGINMLCNNAGVYASADVATVDGYDLQMQVNFLSHFLLTQELMPLLEMSSHLEGGDARIIQQTSVARSIPKMRLHAQYLGRNGGHLGGNSLGLFNTGPRCQRYQQSKLANAGTLLLPHTCFHTNLVVNSSSPSTTLCSTFSRAQFATPHTKRVGPYLPACIVPDCPGMVNPYPVACIS